MARINNFEVISPTSAAYTGEVLAQASFQVHKEGMVWWEEVLTLVVNEKPRFLPLFVWRWMTGMVLTQSARRGDVPRPIVAIKEVP